MSGNTAGFGQVGIVNKKLILDGCARDEDFLLVAEGPQTLFELLAEDDEGVRPAVHPKKQGWEGPRECALAPLVPAMSKNHRRSSQALGDQEQNPVANKRFRAQRRV